MASDASATSAGEAHQVAPASTSGVGRGARPVEDAHLVARREQVPAHRRAHDPGPDPPDAHRGSIDSRRAAPTPVGYDLRRPDVDGARGRRPRRRAHARSCRHTGLELALPAPRAGGTGSRREAFLVRPPRVRRLDADGGAQRRRLRRGRRRRVRRARDRALLRLGCLGRWASRARDGGTPARPGGVRGCDRFRRAVRRAGPRLRGRHGRDERGVLRGHPRRATTPIGRSSSATSQVY